MKRFIGVILIWCYCATLMAQVSFEVLPPRTVVVGDKFSVTFRLQNGEGSTPKTPEIQGCEFLYGPSTSTMQSVQIVNGRQRSSYQIDYTFTYKAVKAGTYSIGSVSVNVDGKKYSSSPTTIKILPPDKNSGQTGAANNNNIANNSSSQTSISDKDVFIRVILNKSEVYEHEAVECVIKLYTKHNIYSLSNLQPVFNGFLTDEISVQPSLNDQETFNGGNYYTAILKKYIIFPQKSGKLNIESGKYTVGVEYIETIRDPFWGLMQRIPQQKEITVKSNSVSLNVKPLPSPAPSGFNGAVGNFSVETNLSSNTLTTNDAAIYSYKITGSGNIKYIKEPIIDFPSEFQTTTPRNVVNAENLGATISGSNVYDYTFIPQSVGTYKIGATEFVYFDPIKKEYITLFTPSYDVAVAQGTATQTVGGTPQEVKTKNSDILHIKLGEKQLSKQLSYFTNSVFYWLCYLFVIVLFVVGVYILQKHIKLNADIPGRRLARANKVAMKRLKLARKYMNTHQFDKFYEEMLRAMWGYLSDKLTIPASQLLRDNISSELVKYGASERLAQDFIMVLDDCEMARYTPSAQDEKTHTIYDLAANAINELENTKQQKRQ